MFAWLAVAIWSIAVAGGGAAFLRYQFTPGAETRAPLWWPADSALARHPVGTTLVSFVHPHCVCTRASLDELAIVMSRQSSPLRAHVVFVQLSGFADAEMRGESWQRAGRIPGVERRVDVGGAEAKRFAALVSGATAIYDASGRLRFDGGVTGSRGHIGANAGRSSAIALLRGGSADVDHTRVFGCALFDRAAHADPPHPGHDPDDVHRSDGI